MAEVRADHARYCEEGVGESCGNGVGKRHSGWARVGIKSLAERLNGGCGMVTT